MYKKKITQKAYKETKKDILEITPIVTYQSNTSIYHLRIKGAKQTTYGNNITIYKMPTHNCQVFSLGSAYQLKNVKSIPLLVRTLCLMKSLTQGRAIMLLDLKDLYIKETLELIKHYTTEIKITPYLSNNGSKMNICIVKLDKNKLAIEEQTLEKLKLLRANTYINPNSDIDVGAYPKIDQRTRKEQKEYKQQTYRIIARREYISTQKEVIKKEVEKRVIEKIKKVKEAQERTKIAIKEFTKKNSIPASWD